MRVVKAQSRLPESSTALVVSPGAPALVLDHTTIEGETWSAGWHSVEQTPLALAKPEQGPE